MSNFLNHKKNHKSLLAPYLGDVNLAPVHEVDELGHVGELHVLEDDDGRLVGVLLEERFEVAAARRQHHLCKTNNKEK